MIGSIILTVPKTRSIVSLSRQKTGRGIGVPKSQGAKRHVSPWLFCAQRSDYCGGLGGGVSRLAGALRPVRQPRSGRLPVIGVARGWVNTLRKESIMSDDTITGGLCPSSTISPKALEKRVRRALSRDALILHRNRAGSITRLEHGEWIVVHPRTNNIIFRKLTLTELADRLGLIDDRKTVEGAA